MIFDCCLMYADLSFSDINECKDPKLNTCGIHKCVNTPGDYYCDCRPGYIYADAGRKVCKGEWWLFINAIFLLK